MYNLTNFLRLNLSQYDKALGLTHFMAIAEIKNTSQYFSTHY